MNYDRGELKAPSMNPAANGEGRRIGPQARLGHTSLDRSYCHCGNPSVLGIAGSPVCLDCFAATLDAVGR